MDIVVVGAGMAGLYAALACANRGAKVTVIDSARGPLQGGSFGSGGYVGPSGVRPLVRPRSFAEHTWLRCSATKPTLPLRYSVGARGKYTQFVKHYVDHCTSDKAQFCHDALSTLAHYNAELLERLVADNGLEDYRTRRVLHLYDTTETLTRLRREQLHSGSTTWLEPKQCHALEPALEETAPLSGGYHHAPDQTIHATYVARQVARLCQEKGVTFHYGTKALELLLRKEAVCGVRTDKGLMAADAVILCNAGGMAELLATAEVKLAVVPTPLTACSVSAEIAETAWRVTNGLYDESNVILFTVMDERIRATGAPFIGTLSGKELESEYRRIYDAALSMLGKSAHWNQAKYWASTVWAMPDSLPLIGAVPSAAGLYLSGAHAMTGAAGVCAAAQIVADHIEGKVPAIDITSAFRCDRFD